MIELLVDITSGPAWAVTAFRFSGRAGVWNVSTIAAVTIIVLVPVTIRGVPLAVTVAYRSGTYKSITLEWNFFLKKNVLACILLTKILPMENNLGDAYILKRWCNK